MTACTHTNTHTALNYVIRVLTRLTDSETAEASMTRTTQLGGAPNADKPHSYLYILDSIELSL